MEMAASATGDFTFAPTLGLVLWGALMFGGLFVGGGVTAAKGRWGWLLPVILSGGFLGCLTAFMLAAPDSAWARRFYGPEKRARAQLVLG